MLTLDHITKELPSEGLREGAQWLFSPQPFELPKAHAQKMMRIGHPLAQFQAASDRVYQSSANGKSPAWIAELLDAGKPKWMVEQQRSTQLLGERPRVIRPDLIYTERGFALTELDSVPGGMGITSWLSTLYAEAGFEVLGGGEGMLEGFKRFMPQGGQVLISEESADYSPEMEYLVQQLGASYEVKAAETQEELTGALYRFFEWFDWRNIPQARKLATSRNLSSPCKPHLEEKLWLALLWSPSLQGLWQDQLRGNHLERLREIVPYGWVVDPTELPPHAALPRLEVHHWRDVAKFSQKQRELVLKISGFNELAWGSRGVVIGHDVSSEEWKQALDVALEGAHSQPWMMQQYRQGKLVEHPYFDPESGEKRIMKGRVRLCPYFFTSPVGYTEFAGCLATIVPADKKKIHGMKDGILVPCIAV